MKILHDLLDQILRVLLGDQNIRADFERKSHKIPFSQDIGERLPVFPSRHVLSEERGLLRGDRALSVQNKCLEVCSAHILKKEPRVQLRLPLLIKYRGKDLYAFPV